MTEGVHYVVDGAGCWVWQRCRCAKGYGRVRWRGRTAFAHRAAWEAAHGAVPAGRQIDHLCRNRACVNIEHMELVTAAENTRRGRSAKLTSAQAREAYSSAESSYALAARFGVNPCTIQRIRRAENWRGVAS